MGKPFAKGFLFLWASLALLQRAREKEEGLSHRICFPRKGKRSLTFLQCVLEEAVILASSSLNPCFATDDFESFHFPLRARINIIAVITANALYYENG